MARPTSLSTLLSTLITLITLPPATASPLAKRDDYPLPIPLMILLIILGAGMAVCVGYAIHKTFGFRASGNGMKSMSAEQQAVGKGCPQGEILKLRATHPHHPSPDPWLGTPTLTLLNS